MPFFRRRFRRPRILPPLLFAGAVAATSREIVIHENNNTQHLDKPIFLNEPSCHNCNEIFGLFTWRHHCRNCGHSFCHQHVNTYVKLPWFNYNSLVRVCGHCYTNIVQQQQQNLKNVYNNYGSTDITNPPPYE